jgi:hypothetical protein
MEYMSNDERIDVLFFNTPMLYRSGTPRPRLSKTPDNLKIRPLTDLFRQHVVRN